MKLEGGKKNEQKKYSGRTGEANPFFGRECEREKKNYRSILFFFRQEMKLKKTR